VNECEVAGHEGRRNTYFSELVGMNCAESRQRRRKEKECLGGPV
jgi:hypothetical protein